MIVLLGSAGYVGKQFVAELNQRGWPFLAPLRAQTDYTRFDDCLAGGGEKSCSEIDLAP